MTFTVIPSDSFSKIIGSLSAQFLDSDEKLHEVGEACMTSFTITDSEKKQIMELREEQLVKPTKALGKNALPKPRGKPGPKKLSPEERLARKTANGADDGMSLQTSSY